MKLGIIGLPQSGKFTIFKALTGARGLQGGEKIKKGDQLIGTVNVVDERVDQLIGIYKPKKTIYAQIEYILPGRIGDPDRARSEKESAPLSAARTCEGLVHVVRNFRLFGGAVPTPEEDFFKLESEMILSDLVVTEKRIERIQSDEKKGREIALDELMLLEKCREILSEDKPLRDTPEIVSSPLLKGFTFLSISSRNTVLFFNRSGFRFFQLP